MGAKLCVGYFSETNSLDKKGEKMMLVRCQANVWGTGAMTDESCDKKRLIAEPVQLTTFPDKNIKLFGDYGDYCWVKKFAGYIVYQEIFAADCADATNDNSSIRGKYQWTYNPDSGLVTSIGSVKQKASKPFCLTANDLSRPYKQNLKINRCDENDPLQQLDYVDGRLHFRAEPRLCVSIIVDELEELGEAQLVAQDCYPGFVGLLSNNVQ